MHCQCVQDSASRYLLEITVVYGTTKCKLSTNTQRTVDT